MIDSLSDLLEKYMIIASYPHYENFSTVRLLNPNFSSEFLCRKLFFLRQFPCCGSTLTVEFRGLREVSKVVVGLCCRSDDFLETTLSRKAKMKLTDNDFVTKNPPHGIHFEISGWAHCPNSANE